MAKDTKKTKAEPTKAELAKTLEMHENLKAWAPFIHWLKTEDDQDTLAEYLEFEIVHACRPAFIDRIRTRFNKVRAYNELKVIENRIGKVINVNHV